MGHFWHACCLNLSVHWFPKSSPAQSASNLELLINAIHLAISRPLALSCHNAVFMQVM